MGIGLGASGILIGLGQYLLPRPRYRAYAQVLMSGGIVIYFISIYAAFALYRLIPFPAAFAVLAVGAIAASAVASANNTEAVAVLCLLGAFVTPVLLQEKGVGEHNLPPLYFYLTALNIWSAVLVKYRGWNSLIALAFAATWIIFFGSQPGHKPDFLLFETFAALFLVFTCYSGVSALSTKAETSPDTARLLILMIVAACVAFAAVSGEILAGCMFFGLPALALAGAFLAFCLFALSVGLPELPISDRATRQLFLYLSAAALFFVMACPLAVSGPLTPSQAPPAFVFTLVTYLVFLGIAIIVQRQEGYERPAAGLLAANALGHVLAARHALSPVEWWVYHPASLWLPLAGWITLLFAWAPPVRRSERPTFRKALLLTAQAFAIVALFGTRFVRADIALGQVWRLLAILWAEFLLLSGTWLAARRLAAFPGLRADILAAFANGAAFFGLMAFAAGMTGYQGIVILCGCALALAVYHALVGAFVLNRPGDDALHRLTYLGLAVTFVTIAIPLQLRQSYLTVAWAVESAVLIYSGIAVKEARVRAYGLVLLAVAAAKALMLDLGPVETAVLLLHNPRMLAGGSVVAAAAISAAFLARARRELSARESSAPGGLMLVANLYALIFLSVGLWQHLGAALPVAGRGSAQQLTLSIFWSAYALALMAVGIWRRAKPVRLLGLGLLFLSIIKVFLFDLSTLQQPYRIVSFFGLGLILLVVSLLYTRFEERLK